MQKIDGFDTNFNSEIFIPEKLKDYELYPKISSMVDYIVRNAAKEFEDIKYKNSGADIVRDEVIKQIITELGYKYIADVMDTITNYQFNQLVEFISVINLLKGSRKGLELILQLLGFDSVITEWWERPVKGKPYTFEMIVAMNSSYVPDVYNTLEKVQIFTRQYVFPVLSNIDFQFGLEFASKNANLAGFYRVKHFGKITARL